MEPQEHQYPHQNFTIAKTAQIVGKSKPQIGIFSKINDYSVVDSGSSKHKTIEIGNRCNIKQGVIIRSMDGHITIANRVSIGEYTVIAGHGGITIGENSIIAGHCYISAANHIFDDTTVDIRFQGETAKGIIIEKNVWIGARVVVLDGVHIGEGAIIGAGAVVTKNIPAGHICVGNPIRILRKRG